MFKSDHQTNANANANANAGNDELLTVLHNLHLL